MKKIFLIEDDHMIAKNLISLLNQENFKVTHVSTQKEAFDILYKEKFDIALIDISLPDGNGFTICTEIKNIQNIPVIFITAFDNEANVVTGLDIGGDDYITKPFRPRELIARINNALKKNISNSSIFQIQDLYVDVSKGIVKKIIKKFIFLL